MLRNENDSLWQIEQFKLKIKEKALIHQSLLEQLGISACENNQKTQYEKDKEASLNLQHEFIFKNKHEFTEFLQTISHLWEMHQSKKDIRHKIEDLFKKIKKDVRSFLDEKEIFVVFNFHKHNFILLILVEQKMITVETIINNIELRNSVIGILSNTFILKSLNMMNFL